MLPMMGAKKIATSNGLDKFPTKQIKETTEPETNPNH